MNEMKFALMAPSIAQIYHVVTLGRCFCVWKWIKDNFQWLFWRNCEQL